MNLGFRWDFSRRLGLLTDLGWVFAHERSDATISRTCYYLNTHLSLNWGKSIQFGFLFGPGIFLTSISGQGGTQTLGNGSSTTDYPLPFNTSLASNITANVGLYLKAWYFSIEILNTMFNPLNSIKRHNQYSATLKLNIPIGRSKIEAPKARIEEAPKPKYQPRKQYEYDNEDDFF